MSGLQNDDVLAAIGSRASLVFARRADGTMEAKEWLDVHSELKPSFGQLFERLVNHGPLFPNKEQFKKIKGISAGSVWEFKRGGDAGHRFFCVEPTAGTRWLLTHHYQKGKSKGDQTKSARLALKISEEHIERERRLKQEHNDDDQTRRDED